MSVVARLPANEQQRLAALRGYNVLDTKREEAFDDLTLIARVGVLRPRHSAG
jgi:hypothetical protein